MVFYAKGLVRVQLHYATQLTIQPVQGFENSCHHFPAADSALPAVDEPSADVLYSPRYYYFCAAAHAAFLIAAASLRPTPLCYISPLLASLHCICKQCHTHRKYYCIPMVVITYVYMQTRSLYAVRLIASLLAQQLVSPRNN